MVDAQGTVGSGEARGLPSGHQRDFVHGASPDPVTTRTERGVADYFDTHGRLIERKTRQDVSLPAFNNLGPNRGQRHYSHRWKHDTRFGRVLAESWPNGVGRSFVYSSIGAVEAELGLGDAMPLTLREVREVNALGQATEEWLGSPGMHGALRIQRTQTLTTGEMESIDYARRATGSASLATIWHETYRYDGWGNLIRRGQSQPDLPTASGSFSQFERYRYDALHRLTRSELITNGASATPVELGYDAVGNLRKKSDFSQNIDSAYSYPAATAARPNAVQSVALASGGSVQHYGHDASGNVVCQFVSNPIGRSCSLQHSFQAYYNHNQQPVYQERLLGVQNSIGSYSTAWFTYGADQQPARQWGFEGTPDCINQPATQGGCLRHHRIHLDRYEDTVGGFVHFDGSERLYRSRAYVGDYLVATRGRYGELELSFLLRDRLGSVVGVEGVTLNNRNLAELRAETRHSFDAYGTPRSNFKRAGSLWSEQPRWSSPTRTQQGFTGHERLSGLQLIHMRGRVFDPQLGRFHGVDPIIQFPLSSQGLNPYSYILNNPLAGVDPTGYSCQAPTGSRIKPRCGPVDDAVNAVNTIVSTARSYGVFASSCGAAACGSNDNGADKQGEPFGVERKDGSPGNVAERGPEPSSSARLMGAGRIAVGGVEVAVAVYACAQTAGIGCFAGAGILATLGADQIYTGATEVWTGVPRESQTVQLFQAAGASLGTARMLEFGINLGAGGVISAPYVGWRASSALPSGGAAGPGVFMSVSETMSAQAAAYQARVAGTNAGSAYVVNGVKFDGFANGVLIDAKSGYTRFVRQGEFRSWFRGADSLAAQAQRQLVAANGTPIQWRFAEESAASATRSLFQQRGISGIDIVHVP